MYRIEDGYGKTWLRTTEQKVAMAAAIELGKKRIEQLIDYSNQTDLPFNGDIQVRYIPRPAEKEVCNFWIEIGEYDEEDNYVEEARYEVIFEG